MAGFRSTWRAPEFEYHPKGMWWYWSTIAIAVFLVAVSAWQQNILFGLFIILAEIMILVWASREPEIDTFTLTEQGLAIEEHKKFYALREIAHFAAYEDWSDDWSTFVLDLKAHFRPSVRIHVPRARFDEVYGAFRSVLPVNQNDPALLDILERFLGF